MTVTPLAGGVYPIGAVMGLYAELTCLTPVAATGTGAVAFTAGTASTAKVLTSTVAVTTGTSLFVCLAAPSATNVATPVTSTVAAVVAPASTKDLIATATGTGYALTYNGSQVDVKTYWPNALNIYGYSSYIRVINTGSVAAPITGAFINAATGIVGTGLQLVASLPAGAATVLTGAQIEAVLGALAFSDRPRLRLTAPTNGLLVQYFLQNQNGAISELSSNQ